MRSGATQSVPTMASKVTVTVSGDTYDTADSPTRVVSVDENQQVWGGRTVILLDNSDDGLIAKTYQGKSLDLTWGFTGDAGSASGKLYVEQQRFVSRAGKLLLELQCCDGFGLLQKVKVVDGGCYWNHAWQTSDELADKVLPSGAAIPSDLIDDIVAHSDKTPQNIVTATILAAVNKVVDTGTDSDTNYTTRKPKVSGRNALDVVVQAMQVTSSYLLWKNDEKFYVVNPSQHATVHSFDDANESWSSVESNAVVIPNRVVWWYLDGDTWSSQSAVDSTSYSAMGFYVDEHYGFDPEDWEAVTTSDEASALATAKMTKLQLQAAKGTLIAPMHCGIELYDAISITDNRYGTPQTFTGYVFGIRREYGRGIYRITLTLGGMERYVGEDNKVYDIRVEKPATVAPPAPDWSTILPKAIQGFDTDITFSETDYDTVAWTSGTITFYDGTTQSIDAGNTGNLATADIYYIWFDLDDESPGTLKVDSRANYLSAFDEKIGLLCLVQRGSASDIAPTIIPSYGKEPLITPDVIDMTGLKEYDYGGSTYLQALLTTQIQAGTIKLSSATTFDTGYDPSHKPKVFYQDAQPTAEQAGDLWVDTNDGNKMWRWSGSAWVEIPPELANAAKTGEWYNESGVEIDASHGINIYGTNQALTTRASKAGTIQCYVGSGGQFYCAAGKVYMDANGIIIDISDSFYPITFKWGSDTRGYIYPTSDSLTIYAAGSWDLNLQGSPIKLGTAVELYGDIDFYPTNGGQGELGTTSKYFKKLWVNDIDVGTDGDIICTGNVGNDTYYPDEVVSDAFTEKSRLLPFTGGVEKLRAIKLTQEGLLDAKTFPTEIQRWQKQKDKDYIKKLCEDLEATIPEEEAKVKVAKIKEDEKTKATYPGVDLGNWIALLQSTILELVDRIEVLEAK